MQLNPDRALTGDPSVPPGVWAVALTPFNPDRSIDWAAYHALLGHYAQAGLHGVFATCASSEVTELTVDESVGLVAAAVALTGDRLPVVAGVRGSDDLDAVAATIRRMADAGARAVVLTPNTLAARGEGDDVLRARLERILAATDPIPLGLYECPLPYRRLISPETFGILARTGRFIFHKDTTCNAAQISAKLAAAEGTPLKLYNANMQTLPASLAAGAAGYCGVATNVYPDLVLRLYEACRDAAGGDEDLHAFLLRAEDVFGPTYPLAAKRLLAWQGVPMQPVCRVAVAADDTSTETHLRALLHDIAGRRRSDRPAMAHP